MTKTYVFLLDGPGRLNDGRRKSVVADSETAARANVAAAYPGYHAELVRVC
jgi:hypothetical protein